ncbi:hypothetical protein CDAR_541931 [Caerostris darwini]|uniref:Secreted protein n=1 Tax=Caerostris darwini TaxID=1538125 RepID=A0AAV4UVJ7_9ARAC|nr:hypothetical protein CDAR_541931 [Caerostris darwini]
MRSHFIVFYLYFFHASPLLPFRHIAVLKSTHPSSRSRTSDLWISVIQTNYSPPLCQLSYRRMSSTGL